MSVISPVQQRDLLKLLAAEEKSLLQYMGVHYIDIGYKYVKNILTSQLALRLHVFSKKPSSRLPAKQFVPQNIHHLPTDILQSNRILEKASPSIRDSRCDPLLGGVAIRSLRHNLLGTLGAIVIDRETRRLMGLSNHHVLVGAAGQAGDAVAQPATSKITDIIGTVTRWNETLDCAVCSLNSSRMVSRYIMDIPSIPCTVKEPLIGMKVVKSGRTTGKTFGIIDGVSEHEFTIIPLKNDGVILDTEISGPGDSGALWLEVESCQAVGLHYAGEKDPSPQAERAWAKKMPLVAEALSISFH